MRITLKIWRQASRDAGGQIATYHLDEVSPDMSFLEMLDVLNEKLIEAGGDPVAFDHDCREGICGACSQVIDGQAHGPERSTTVCQLHMRHYSDGATIYVEPWRARAFPVLKDLVVDRGALDRIQAAGGFISVHTGSVPEASAILVQKEDSDRAMDAAACIGCGACVAACPNSAAMLFVGAKLAHLSLLPQGAVERDRRVLAMVRAMDAEGFGICSNHYECEAACPKEISVETIARMNRQYLAALLRERPSRAPA
ncbi:MAG: succinate dehydrogenase/fumarate reductase iron-sulfur subunit [Planctomycetota bacterium]